LHATVDRLFGDWDGAGPALAPPVTGDRPGYRHVFQGTAQEQIGLAYPTAALGEPGYYDARMAIEVLSGGMSGRLFTEVREKRGLCYSVRAMHGNVRGAGTVFAYAGTTPERAQDTLDVLSHELVRLAEGVTDEELARARTGLLSALIMQSEATRARAVFLARDQYLLGRVRTMDEIREAIEQVTPDSIQETLRRLPARDFTIATLGPQELKVNA
jgi:predicted Zn-dependent peptidase